MKENIGRKSTILALSNIFNIMMSIITSMIISRYRTVEENGTYSQLMLVVTTITPFVILGLPNSITYFVGKLRSSKEKNNYLALYYTSISCLCLVLGVVLFLLTPQISKYYRNNYIKDYSFVLLLLPFSLQITTTFSDVLISLNKINILIVYRILFSLSLLIAAVSMVILKLTFFIYMCMYICVLLLFTIITFVIIKIQMKSKILFFDKDLLIDVLRFSIPIGLATIVSTISLQFDNIFISAHYNTETLGIYTNMARELPIVAVTQAISSILLPCLARLIASNQIDDGVKIWKTAANLSYIIVCFFSTVVFVFAPEIISILYSDKYMVGLPIFRIYTFALLMRFAYFGIFLNCMGQTKKIMFFSIFGLTTNIILNYVFYYSIGYWGPAVATVTSTIFTNLLQLGTTSKVVGVSISKLLPWKSITKITICNVMFGITFYFIQLISPLKILIGSNFEAIILGGVWATIYFVFQKGKLLLLWNRLKVE